MALRNPSRYYRPRQDPEDKIAGGPPSPSSSRTEEDSDGPKPIGVPRGYTVPSVRVGPVSARQAEALAASNRRLPGTVFERGPRYFDGDQWRIASTSPQTVTAIQRAMVNAGLLNDFKYGVWDERSADAYAKVLAYANAAGISDQMALQQMAENPDLALGGGGSSGGGSGGRQIVGFDENGDPIFSEYVPPPLELRTTNKEDLKNLFRSLTAEKLGIGWNDAQLNELVDAYNWQEIRVQRSNYDQQVALERQAFNEGPEAIAGKALNIEEPPEREAFLQEELIRRDPVGYQAAQVGLSAVDMFREALGRYS